MPPTLSSPRGYPLSVENPLCRINVDLFRCAESVSPLLHRNKATLTRWRGVFPLHRVERSHTRQAGFFFPPGKYAKNDLERVYVFRSILSG